MSLLQPFDRVKPFCGLIFAEPSILDSSLKRLEEFLSPQERRSDFMPFTYTDYYCAEMGKPLFRCFVSFRELIDPQFLPDCKRLTQELEAGFAVANRRRVNLDPGYISLASVVIATAKNHSHRIPLRDGVYAHLEYVVRNGRLQQLDWTYPDFRSSDYMNFFTQLRRDLKDQLRRESAAAPD